MNKSVFFLVTLIVIASCSTSRVISYDGMIDKLVQLNQAAGKDKNDIGLLVSQVSSASKENSDKFDSFFNGLHDRCDGGRKVLTDYIEKLEADKLNVNTRSNQATEDNKKIESDRVKLADQLSNTQAELKALKVSVSKEIEAFRQYGAEAEAKLVIIKSLRDIINDELVNPQGGQSFIQLSTFSSKLRQLKSLLQNSKDNQYAPLVSTLLQLAEGQGFSNSKILDEILSVLSKLENNLIEFRAKQNTQGKANIENLKTQAQEKVIQIKSVATMIAEANNTHQDNQNIIDSSKVDSANIVRDVERKQAEVKYWNNVCAYQDEVRVKETTFRAAFDVKVREVSTRLLELK